MESIRPYTEDLDHLDVETPERLTLRLPLAGLGSRFIAQMLDDLIRVVAGLVVVLLLFLAIFMFGITLGPESQGVGTLLGAIVGVAMVVIVVGLYIGYDVYFESQHNGQTPGKGALGIRVVMDDGRPVTAQAAFVRAIIGLIDSLPSYWILGGLIALLRKDRKRLGDVVAGTAVVRRAARVVVSMREPFAAPGQVAFTRDQLGGLGSRDYRLLVELRERSPAHGSGMPLDAYVTLQSRVRQNLADRIGCDSTASDHVWLADLEHQLENDLGRR